jgi:outer membrane protein TolC
MGLPMMEIKDFADVLTYEDWGVSIEKAVERALSNRPDLVAQRRRVEYAETLLHWRRRGLPK